MRLKRMLLTRSQDRSGKSHLDRFVTDEDCTKGATIIDGSLFSLSICLFHRKSGGRSDHICKSMVESHMLCGYGKRKKREGWREEHSPLRGKETKGR